MDRNLFYNVYVKKEEESLSARRAWIEIETPQTNSQTRTVALRKESVDRNTIISQTVSEIIGSLSARRAWIEISVKDLNAHLY